MIIHARKSVLLVLIVTALLLLACGERNYEAMTAKDIYDSGMQDFEKKHYSRSLEAFMALVEIYPFSMYVTPAELRTADSYYGRRMYAEAVGTYNDFLTRHPTNKEVPHAVYMLGLSNYKQKQAIDRDQAYTVEALKYFQRVIKQHPDSENYSDALVKAGECRHDLAKRERYVARFYFRNKEYYSALGRYEVIIDEYNDTEYYEEALYMAGRCLVELKTPEQARITLNALIDQFPDGKYASRARALLDKLD